MGLDNKLENYHIKYFVFLAVIILLAAGYTKYNYYIVEKIGTYSIAKYLRKESEGDGSISYFELNFKKNKVEITLTLFEKAEIGKYYFVKINRNKPNRYGILTNIEVPQCILDSLETKLPPEGWKEIPNGTCK
jgi:hypothetical protein